MFLTTFLKVLSGIRIRIFLKGCIHIIQENWIHIILENRIHNFQKKNTEIRSSSCITKISRIFPEGFTKESELAPKKPPQKPQKKIQTEDHLVCI